VSKRPAIGFSAKPVPHQITAMDAIAKSLDSAGLRYRMAYNSPIPEEIAVVWGWGRAKEIRETNPEAIILCLDHGYSWGRKQYVNTGWSTPDQQFGLNGFAEHVVVDDGGERSREKGWWDELQPWKGRTNGNRALFFGQVYGDAMIVDHVQDYGLWLRELAAAYQEAGYSVAFRPHPNMVLRGAVDRYGNVGSRTANKNLLDDLEAADCAVAMNSNALVQALCYGIDVTAYNKGTMLWPYLQSDRSLASRKLWWARMAWAQWTYEDLANGTWLRYNLPIMDRLLAGEPCRPWHTTRLGEV